MGLREEPSATIREKIQTNQEKGKEEDGEILVSKNGQ
jgi:hypothetical protein